MIKRSNYDSHSFRILVHDSDLIVGKDNWFRLCRFWKHIINEKIFTRLLMDSFCKKIPALTWSKTQSCVGICKRKFYHIPKFQIQKTEQVAIQYVWEFKSCEIEVDRIPNLVCLLVASHLLSCKKRLSLEDLLKMRPPKF